MKLLYYLGNKLIDKWKIKFKGSNFVNFLVDHERLSKENNEVNSLQHSKQKNYNSTQVLTFHYSQLFCRYITSGGVGNIRKFLS